MAILSDPMDARINRIEDRLGVIEQDLAAIKTRLEQLPSRWVQGIALLAILLPIYSIMVTLLWTTIHH